MPNNPYTCKTGSIRLKANQRRPEVLRLRTQGHTIREIAYKLGCSPTTVLNDLNQTLQDLQQQTMEAADTMLTIELERLDNLQSSLWDSAMAGDHKSTDRILKIMERRAKLLGLDTPTKIASTTPDGKDSYHDMSEKELDKRIAELQAKHAEEGGTKRQDR